MPRSLSPRPRRRSARPAGPTDGGTWPGSRRWWRHASSPRTTSRASAPSRKNVRRPSPATDRRGNAGETCRPTRWLMPVPRPAARVVNQFYGDDAVTPQPEPRRYMSATAGPGRWSSDLRVAVFGGGRDLRDDIPVLDDLAVRVEAEDVDDLAAEWPVDRNGTGEERVRDDEVAVGEDPLDVDVHVGERVREAGDELNECVEAVRRERVVLDVLIAAVLLDGECRVLVVERHRVVADHVLLVALQQRPAVLARLGALVAHRFSPPVSWRGRLSPSDAGSCT